MATIYILDQIGPQDSKDSAGNWIPTVSAKSIINQLAWLPATEAVEVLINSPGGSVFEGISIYNVLKSRGNVTTKVVGVAASIAAVIFCAGTERLMCPGSYLMIHNPIVPVLGDEAAHLDAAKAAKAMAENYAAMIASASGKTVEEILALMSEETWINAIDSVALGVATGIDEDAEELKIAASITSLYHNIPGELMNKMQSTTGSASASAAVADATDAVLERIESFKALAFDGFDFMALIKDKATPEQAVAKMYEGLKAKHSELLSQVVALKAENETLKASAVTPAPAPTPVAKDETAALLKAVQEAGVVVVPKPGEAIDHRAVMAMIKDPVERSAYWQKHIKPTLGGAYKV